VNPNLFAKRKKMKSIVTAVAGLFAVSAFAQAPAAAKKEEAKPAAAKAEPAKKDEKKAEPAKK
jgi:ribosomal protein L12E/L44/L45/RPP1/RPP2